MSRFYTVLCEDLQAFVFIRLALIETGANSRCIFKHPYPDSRFHSRGGGSPRNVDGYVVYACGSQHIRMNYPRALASVRVQHAKRKAALVVHTDVDNTAANGATVAHRIEELDAACSASQVPRRTVSDPVALLIARREVETWIHFLRSGPPVDEVTQYSKLTGCEADCQPTAEAFARHASAGTLPTPSLPSLTSGIAELAKVV